MKKIMAGVLLGLLSAPLAAQVSTNSEKGQILFACKTGDGGAMLLLNSKGKIALALGDSFGGQPKTLFLSDHENVGLHQYSEEQANDTWHKRHMFMAEHGLVINWGFSGTKLRPPEVEVQKIVDVEGTQEYEDEFRVIWTRHCQFPNQIKYDTGPVETTTGWGALPG